MRSIPREVSDPTSNRHLDLESDIFTWNLQLAAANVGGLP